MKNYLKIYKFSYFIRIGVQAPSDPTGEWTLESRQVSIFFFYISKTDLSESRVVNGLCCELTLTHDII